LIVAFNRTFLRYRKSSIGLAVMDNGGCRQLCRLHCAAQYDRLRIVCGLGILLLPGAQIVPPFSSYGGILSAAIGRAFFIRARTAGARGKAWSKRRAGLTGYQPRIII
jgi:hypothetical protein